MKLHHSSKMFRPTFYLTFSLSLILYEIKSEKAYLVEVEDKQIIKDHEDKEDLEQPNEETKTKDSPERYLLLPKFETAKQNFKSNHLKADFLTLFERGVIGLLTI